MLLTLVLVCRWPGRSRTSRFSPPVPSCLPPTFRACMHSSPSHRLCSSVRLTNAHCSWSWFVVVVPMRNSRSGQHSADVEPARGAALRHEHHRQQLHKCALFGPRPRSVCCRLCSRVCTLFRSALLAVCTFVSVAWHCISVTDLSLRLTSDITRSRCRCDCAPCSVGGGRGLLSRQPAHLLRPLGKVSTAQTLSLLMLLLTDLRAVRLAPLFRCASPNW